MTVQSRTPGFKADLLAPCLTIGPTAVVTVNEGQAGRRSGLDFNELIIDRRCRAWAVNGAILPGRLRRWPQLLQAAPSNLY